MAPCGGWKQQPHWMVSIAVFGLPLAVGATDAAAIAALRGFASHKLDIAVLDPIRIVKVAKAHTAVPGRHPVVVVAQVSARDKEAIWRAKSKLGPECPASITLHQEHAPRGRSWRGLPTWFQALYHLYPPLPPPLGPTTHRPIEDPTAPRKNPPPPTSTTVPCTSP